MDVFKTFRFFASLTHLIGPTLKPGGVVLLGADDVMAAKTTEEGRVPAHEV